MIFDTYLDIYHLEVKRLNLAYESGSSTLRPRQPGLGLALAHMLTGDLGLEGAAYNVLRSSILDRDEVVSRSRGCVGHPVTFRTLLKVHLHFGRPINGYRQSSRTSVTCVHHEV